MPKTEAQKRANAKWAAKAYDQININVRKGQREFVKSFAEQHGYSLSGFIVEAITEKIERIEQTGQTTERRVQPYRTPPRTVYTLNGQEFLGRRALQDYLRSINVNVTDSVINNYITEGRIGAATLAKYPILSEIRRKEADVPTNTEQTNGTD